MSFWVIMKQRVFSMEHTMLDPLYMWNEPLNSNFTYDEVEKVIRSAKNKTSPGIDGGWVNHAYSRRSATHGQVGFGGMCRYMRGDLMWTCLVWTERSTPDNFGVPSHRFNSAIGEQKEITQTIYTDSEPPSRMPNSLMPSANLRSANLPCFLSSVWHGRGSKLRGGSPFKVWTLHIWKVHQHKSQNFWRISEAEALIMIVLSCSWSKQIWENTQPVVGLVNHIKIYADVTLVWAEHFSGFSAHSTVVAQLENNFYDYD